MAETETKTKPAETKAPEVDVAALVARLDAAEKRLAQLSAAPAPATAPAEKKSVKLTGDNTHRAIERGYAIPQPSKDEPSPAGVLVGPDEETNIVPANVPISENWMEPIAAKDRKVARAVSEAQDENPKDVDLTQLEPAALQALAALKGINPGKLSKADLITAIRAEREPTI